jgi:hypothetical protein
VLLAGEEMQYIVDNLFVGNKLSTAEIVTTDGVRLDLRKIRSPIICLCSKGDNITPPQQALGWITDLYRNTRDILAADQTIVYSVHETVGHLGIFVSGSVAQKEHQEFAENIDLIDCLPPGLYEAVIQPKTEGAESEELASGDHISRFEARALKDIRALGGNTQEEERCFAAVARVSEITNGLYQTTLQPAVRAVATQQGARWRQRLHPQRLGYEIFSDRNPAMRPLAHAAARVADQRRPVSADNVFLQWERLFSAWMKTSLEAYGAWRDHWTEQTFFALYDQPWLQALLGLRASDQPPRQHPGLDGDHMALVERRMDALDRKMDQGGLREAALRALVYLRMPARAVDERGFEMLRRVREKHGAQKPLAEFKQDLREQYFMLRLDEERAIALIPKLLEGHEAKWPAMLEDIHMIVTAARPLGEEGKRRLAQLRQLVTPDPRPKKPRKKPVSRKAAKRTEVTE